MNLIDALNALAALEKPSISNVAHTSAPNNVWSIDNLKDQINEVIAEGRLEDTSDKGEWTVDADGITQLDDNGYRTSNRYIAA